MPPPGLDRIKAIFVEAMEKNGLERQAFVHKACGNDAELLAEVEAFLAASEKAGDFLTGSTVGGSQEILRERPGTIIGPYKLLQLIGEGGFGCVFLAEQERPVRRQVALKIIKLGMDTKQVIARFEAERQALAMMDHPNIARVYEAGATETGRPYFVMEMIRGIPITEFCDNERLTTRQRAELFIQVCNAIQHAHQKGVIHRDVKPSNVLVTMHDDRAIPKVIDFGIAKAITGRLTERTLFTEFRQFLGTPAYMSPEQAEFNEVDVDTRSDVYSLGVLLYELLTSGTPFDATELRVAAYEEIRRIILEVEPPKPSTRISGLGATLSSVAQRRRVEPEKLLHSIQGDLDWIVMKCLEKNRSRRYETANALAMDVQRHLKNEPIVARPWSAAYRFRKIVGRNRLAFAVAGALLSILILGICVSTWQAVRASRARNDAQAAEREETHLRSDAEAALAEAQAQRDEAVKQKQIAAAVNNFLGDMLSKADPRAAGQDTTVMQAIDSAVKLLDAGAMKDQPLVEASLRVTIGKAQSDLASTVAAKQNLSRSIELYRQVWPADRIGLARALFELGRIENAAREFAATESILREALRIVTTTPGASEKDQADCLSALATSLSGLDKNSEAEPMTRKSLAMFRDLGNDSDLAWGLVQSAWVLQNEGKFAEAEAMNREAVKLGQRSLPPSSTTLKWIVMHLAQILSQEGKYTESEVYFREELAITQRAYPPGDLKIAGALQDLGNMLVAAGKLAEAEKIMRQALAISQSHRPQSDADIGGALLSLGYTLVEEKKYGQAEPYLLQSVPLLEGQKMPRQQLYAVNALTNLGDIYSRQGEYSKAESFYRQALAVSEQNDPGGKLKIVYAFQNLGSLLTAEGKVGEAEQDMKQALTTVLAFFPNNDEEIGAAQMNLGYAQMMNKKYPEAEASFRLALLSTQKVKTARCLKNTSYSLTSLGDDLRMEQKYSDSESVLQQAMDFDQNLYLPESWEIAEDLIDMGVTLDDEKKLGDAEAIDRKAMEMFQRVNPADNLDIANAQENLGDVLCEQGKYGQAEPLLRNALKAFQKKGGDAMKSGIQDTAKYLAIVLDNTHRSSEAAELRREFAVSRPSTRP